MDQETCKIRWKCKECSNKDFASKQTAVNHANKYHGDSDPGLIIVKVSKSIHLKTNVQIIVVLNHCPPKDSLGQ